MENLNKQAIVNIYKNTKIAIQSIIDLIDEVKEEKFKSELNNQLDSYKDMEKEISSYINSQGLNKEDINPLQKAMMFTSIKLKTLGDNSTSHIADMMIKGTVMGITELKQLLSRSQGNINKDILDLANKLLRKEETFERTLKSYL